MLPAAADKTPSPVCTVPKNRKVPTADMAEFSTEKNIGIYS